MQNCSICEAKPNEVSDIRNLNNFKPCEGTLIYDMSPLHAWIRVFQCLFHVSYRLEIKNWRVSKLTKVSLIFMAVGVKLLLLQKKTECFIEESDLLVGISYSLIARSCICFFNKMLLIRF